MFLFSSRAIRAALLPIALGIFVASANAQQAKFTLPFETQWGQAVLPAGEYSMNSSDTLSWPKVLSVFGKEKSVYILAGVETLAPEGEGESYLRIETVGNAHVVREYRSGL